MCRLFLCIPAILTLAVLASCETASNTTTGKPNPSAVAAERIAKASPRQTIDFDNDWQFHLGDVDGGEKVTAPSAAWRTLNLPHDYSIEGPPGADPSTMTGPFDRRSPAGGGGGFLNAGTTWYRKTFNTPTTDPSARVSIQFDGVYMDSTIYLNGEKIGVHPYGYTPFVFDITSKLKFGQPNVIAVKTNVQQPSSRWYSGAGIYRHVFLNVTKPVHLAQWGTYVTTPQVTDNATVRVRTAVQNDSNQRAGATVTSILLDPAGKEIARTDGNLDVAAATTSASGTQEFDQTLAVKNPALWSTDSPTLYSIVSEVRVNGTLMDSTYTPFGIRTFEFTADNGFLLNGKRVPIQGVCDHHDLGPLGSAVNHRAIERQLQILKGMGCNAIRTSHNPPDPELLDLCDQMGFVVMDEPFDEWKQNKIRNGFGYGRFFDEWSEYDITTMVRRDRNHPSIVMWSIGNEIPEQRDAANGGPMAKRLADLVKREDPTRVITSACNNPQDALRTGFAAALDVFGINYHPAQYQTSKGKVMVGSETSSTVSSRGEYNLVAGTDGNPKIENRLNNQVTSYDLYFPAWATRAEDEFKALKGAPWVAGEFVWTGFDYIGEPTPFPWPARSSYFGIVDLCGFPKDRYYLYQSQWTTKPMVHILPHWNWEQFTGKEIPVWTYSNADSVELFLNGKSLGSKNFKDTQDLHLEWKVPFTPGSVKAVAMKNGQVVATDEIRTAGKPAKLVLTPDRTRLAASGDDLSFIKAEIQDEYGIVCPNADQEIKFNLTGPALIAGLDNGDATNLEPFKGTQHKAFHGLALAVIRTQTTPGNANLTATIEGLPPATVHLDIKP